MGDKIILHQIFIDIKIKFKINDQFSFSTYRA